MEFEKYLPKVMCNWIKERGNLQDITLIRNKNMFVTENGVIIESPFFVGEEELENIVNKMCKGSVYANQHTLKEGFITLDSGHRVGVVGTYVLNDENKAFLRDISAINIRISREIKGVGDKIIGSINEGERIYNTLIISPPSAGKTTILRDVARILGDRFRVGIVDERGEIAKGKDVGKFTFVMEECGKNKGIMMLLRSMSPDVIITDEIGNDEDETAIKTLINAGVKIICTAHGYDENDLLRRSVFKKLIDNKIFERIIILSKSKGVGTVEKLIDNR